MEHIQRMDGMTVDEVLTQLQMRLQEHHRNRKGDSDMDVGFRMGILTAMNITASLKNADDTLSHYAQREGSDD